MPIHVAGERIVLGPGSYERKSLEGLKAMGRKKIIEMAREMALETGSRMVPATDEGVKVLIGPDRIKVELAEGYRAYDDDDTRRIETTILTVHFFERGGQVTHEGDDILTERDREVMDLVLKRMPPNYEFVHITIIDDRKDPDNYHVQISSENTMGAHTVNKRTGEWTYEGHKHSAGRPEENWMELKE